MLKKNSIGGTRTLVSLAIIEGQAGRRTDAFLVWKKSLLRGEQQVLVASPTRSSKRFYVNRRNSWDVGSTPIEKYSRAVERHHLARISKYVLHLIFVVVVASLVTKALLQNIHIPRTCRTPCIIKYENNRNTRQVVLSKVSLLSRVIPEPNRTHLSA